MDPTLAQASTDDEDEMPFTDTEVTYEDDHPSVADDVEDDERNSAAFKEAAARRFADPKSDKPDDGEDEDGWGDDVSAEDLFPSAHREVRLCDLHLEFGFWKNPRSVSGLDDADLRELGATIAFRTVSVGDRVYAGIVDALKVVRVMVPGTGKVIDLVIDGQRRVMAARLAGKGAKDDAIVRVIDLEPDPVTLTRELAAKYLVMALETEGTRRGISSFERAESAQSLRNTKNLETGKDYTMAEVGRSVGRSESWVSKVLSAMSVASAKLIHSWRNGLITDEQFKDLASVKDPAKQREKITEVIEARKSGDKAGGRTIAKEQKAVAARDKPPKPVKEAKASKSTKAEPVARAKPAPAVAAAAAPVRKPPPFAVIEDLVAVTNKTPPTHDYVKGIIDGARWATGTLDPDKFAKPWHTFMNRAAPAQAASVRKPAKGGKAK